MRAVAYPLLIAAINLGMTSTAKRQRSWEAYEGVQNGAATRPPRLAALWQVCAIADATSSATATMTTTSAMKSRA